MNTRFLLFLTSLWGCGLFTGIVVGVWIAEVIR